MILQLGNARPKRRGQCFVAPGAILIGDITLGENSSVWFNAVVRADNDQISLGANTNEQDGAVLHCYPGVPLIVGDSVTVCHQATVHGCTVGDFTLIGINATVLNGAVIGKHCLIGAHALVTEGMVIPDGSLVVGSPAKVLKPLSDSQKESLSQSAKDYAQKAAEYSKNLGDQELIELEK